MYTHVVLKIWCFWIHKYMGDPFPIYDHKHIWCFCRWCVPKFWLAFILTHYVPEVFFVCPTLDTNFILFLWLLTFRDLTNLKFRAVSKVQTTRIYGHKQLPTFVKKWFLLEISSAKLTHQKNLMYSSFPSCCTEVGTVWGFHYPIKILSSKLSTITLSLS